MLRIAILALSAALAVTPALAETTSQPATGASSNQPLLLDDGTNALAQADQNGQRNDMWIGIGMFAIPAAILIALGIHSQRRGVSP